MTNQISKNREIATYKVGQTAEESGCYICVPCGYKRYFTAGERFTNCLKCFGKGQRFKKGLELWEKIDSSGELFDFAKDKVIEP